MHSLDHRYFKPWIGSNYKNNEKSILILGESIYRCKHLSPTRCVDLIRNNFVGIETHKFYTNIFLAFMGSDSSRELEYKKRFWNSVAFFNFVDDVVEGGSRHAPHNDSFEKARLDWVNLINVISPSHIVCLGKRLWVNMPKPNSSSTFSVAEMKPHPIFEYSHSNGTAKATYIYHPSVGFSSKRWHKVISEFLQN